MIKTHYEWKHFPTNMRPRHCPVKYLIRHLIDTITDKHMNHLMQNLLPIHSLPTAAERKLPLSEMNADVLSLKFNKCCYTRIYLCAYIIYT